MKEIIKTVIDGKQITFFRNENDSVPIVYANMYTEVGKAVLEQCEKLGCKPFHLVSITELRWDEELSPWAHEPVVSKSDHFTGEANQYAHCMEVNIIPLIENKIGLPTCRIIAGYSMGGLFALYAPYVTDLFSSVVSASGSVWYPEFISYVKSHDFVKKPDAIYLSLGDQESRTKNPFLKQTENGTKELFSIYQSKGINSVFELNPGNHYKDAVYRMAKGITWILNAEKFEKI
ncbi:MAG: alpha/beta hydrolase-fold protein [Bacteroides sp.]|nr:alpha/beta hydrolase-fold protein [Bacteroides sp.]MCM1550257.1 alpha/beta hydrolase-fold protein [Clostridium sp.]